MKKLLTLLTMALIAISANAQAVIGEIDWSTEEVFNNWCSGENGSTAVVGAEGLEINLPAAGENYWNPQTVVLNIPGQSVADNPDAPAVLAEDGRYQVIIVAKHPAGHLQVNLGTWDDGVSLQKDFDVEESTDFHEIVVDFSEGWPADCFSNVHVLWQSGALPGLSILKKVQIIDLDDISGEEGILYNFIAKGKVAEVKKVFRNAKDVIIPATVMHEGKEYTVNKISDNAFMNCRIMTSVSIPRSVTSIGNYAFSGCASLTSITIPKSVTTIGESAFYGCSKLSSVKIPNSVTTIGESAFSGCSKLSSVNIPNSVTTIGESAFQGCSKLSSVTIPNTITNIESYTFSGCSSLSSVNIPNSVTSIGYSAFSSCKGLATVTIPNSVTSIGNDAFSNCTGLTSVNIPSSVIYLSGFSGCTGLTSITIPNSVTSINGSAFRNCTGLTSITIPNSVTWIYDYAFSGCSELKSVTIGNNVKSISSGAFADCPELTDVYCNAENIPSTNVDAFEGSYIEYATLHVPKGCIGTYKDVKPWKNFKSIVEIVDAKVELNKTEATIEKGKTLTLKATITPSDLADKSVTWKSSNKKVATVSSSGKVKGVKAGTATITCTSNATGLKATCKVTVVNGLVTLNKTEAYVQKGKTMTLKATVTPKTLTDKSVTWESSDKKIATVTKAGKVKGVKYGTATITCTSVATGAKATCQVTVGKVVIGTSEVTIKKSRETILIPFLYPEDLADKSVTWKSSDKSIATVNDEGRVKGIKAGTATITCTSVATGLKGTCTVTVLSNSEARSMNGDDDELTDIKELESSAVIKPFDVYDLGGRKVLHQVTSLDGLSEGIYIVNGKKILKK